MTRRFINSPVRITRKGKVPAAKAVDVGAFSMHSISFDFIDGPGNPVSGSEA